MSTSPKRFKYLTVFLCVAAAANWYLLYEKFQSIGVCRVQVEKVQSLQAKVALLNAESSVGKTQLDGIKK